MQAGEELSPWVVCPEFAAGHSRAAVEAARARISRAMKYVLVAAGLPEHHSPHGLRHTFASLLLQQGESLEYVKRQLGHNSIKLTSDTYGRWLPASNQAAVERLASRVRASRPG